MPSISLAVSLRGQLLSGTRSAPPTPFSPIDLFASNEPGVWYDPSDLTTLFTDTAGTTPVTAPGQTVARMNDKSGRGNNATQAAAASCPTYGVVPQGGRRNLLTWSEDFSNAVWSKQAGTTVTANQIAAPDGTTTADLVVGNGTNGLFSSPITVPSNSQNTKSVWLRGVSGGETVILKDSTQTVSTVSCNLTTSWQRFTLTETQSGTTLGLWVDDIPSGGIYVWGAQLELGSTATAYQRVSTAFDVTEAGVQSLSYLNFDGVDDFMVTPTITPGIDKVQVFAGVRKLSDAAVAQVVGTRGVSTANVFEVLAPSGTGGGFYFASTGTSTSVAEAIAAAPATRVLTGLGDISGDRATLRLNSTQVAQATTDQGTGNYSAQAIYIGRRGGTTLPLNGNIFSLLVRFGANLDTTAITNTEAWVASKSGFPNWANIVSPTIFARDDTAVLDRANSIIERRA